MRYVVLSKNENKEYAFYAPIVKWAWEQLGWQVIILEAQAYHIDGIRTETIAQCSRLYTGNLKWLNEDDYLMTSDIDMLPLSNYWHPNELSVTTWGHDLTNYGHYPICYIGASVGEWRNIMMLTGDIVNDMKRDFDKYKQATSNEWSEWWQVDQDIITDRLKDVILTKVLRGVAKNSHYPLGRVDRGAWDVTLQQNERIDSHLLRRGWTKDNWDKTLTLIKETFPKADVSWMDKYREEYAKGC